jgi:hypothetical protein
MTKLLNIGVLLFIASLARPALAFDKVEPVNLYVVGDDETEYLYFPNLDNPLEPTTLRFTGSAYSEVGPTSLVVHFEWFDSVRHRVSLGEFDLPGTTPDDEYVFVPIDVEYTIPYSPGTVALAIEGRGCCDQIRIQGEFQHAAVPEPSTFALASLGGIGLLAYRIRRRRVRPALVG